MKILTIGGAMRDIFIQHSCIGTASILSHGKEQAFVLLPEGKKIEVNRIDSYLGGGAANSAVSFARLGHEVAVCCKVGKDHDAQFVLNALQSENIDTSAICTSVDVPTGNSFVLPCTSGDRTLLVHRGANLTLIEDDIPHQAIQQSNLVYITSLSGETSKLLPAITKSAKQVGNIVATNPGTSQLTSNVETLKEALSAIDILILNSFEAQLLMDGLVQMNMKAGALKQNGRNTNLPPLMRMPISQKSVCFTLEQFFREVSSHGPKTIVVTNGADGIYATDSKQIYYCPSIKKPAVVSTLGAGDAFGSTFTAYLASEKPIEEAIRAGIANAASVIAHLDTQSGLLSKGSIIHLLESNSVEKTRTFAL